MIKKDKSLALDEIDPRQALAVTSYKDPKSDTFGNLAGSLRKAGYSATYINSFSGRSPKWLTTNLKDTVNMVQSAERNLKRYAKMTVDLDTPRGVDLAKLQVDVSKFIAKTLAKDKYDENSESNAPEVNVKIVQYGGTVTDVEIDKGDIIEGQ